MLDDTCSFQGFLLDLCMSKEVKVEDVLGAEPTVEDLKKAIKRDIGNSLAFLKVLHGDDDLLNEVARFVHGRMQNSQEKVKQMKAANPELFQNAVS